MLAIAICPVAVPLVDGAKVTLKVAFWPAARVIGRLNPQTPKPDPVVLACEIVTLEPPWLLIVADCVLLLPTGMSPKAMLEGLAASTAEATPVPERDMVVVLV